MKKSNIKIILSIILFSFLVLSACNKEKGGPAPQDEKEIVISGLGSNHWTYFSFEKGTSIGTSRFLSDEEDKSWAQRNDWDFAICGDYLKTNGGTSGSHLGGMYKDTQNNFLNIEEAPIEGYSIDEIGAVK